MSTYTYLGAGVDLGHPVRPVAKCGTDGGYYRHRRVTKTSPCVDCRLAHAAAEQARYWRRKVAS